MIAYVKRNEVRLMWFLTIGAWVFFLSWAALRWSQHPISSGLGIGICGLDLFVGVEIMRFFVWMTPLAYLRKIRLKTSKAGTLARLVFYPVAAVGITLFVVSSKIVTPATEQTAWIIFGTGAVVLGCCCIFLSTSVATSRVKRVRGPLRPSERALGIAWAVSLLGSVFLIVNGFVQVA